jgi:hypothetical protein
MLLSGDIRPADLADMSLPCSTTPLTSLHDFSARIQL